MDVYVEFKTWAEGPIETPWPFVIIGNVDEYRSRDDNRIAISESRVRGVFMTFDQALIARFLSENVTGVLVGAVIDCQDISDVGTHLESIFGFCKIEGMIEVTPANRRIIEGVMQHAGKGSGAGRFPAP